MSEVCSVCGAAAKIVVILGAKFAEPPDNTIIGAECDWRCADHIPLIKVFDHPWVKNFEKKYNLSKQPKMANGPKKKNAAEKQQQQAEPEKPAKMNKQKSNPPPSQQVNQQTSQDKYQEKKKHEESAADSSNTPGPQPVNVSSDQTVSAQHSLDS